MELPNLKCENTQLEIAAKRVIYVDIFRAIGIILMIMGHIPCFGSRFDHFIHAFHMPMFFFVTGFFYKTDDLQIKKTLTKKTRTLLIPYICFGIFYWILGVMISWPSMNFVALIKLFSWNTSLPDLGAAIWFLTALFLAEMIYTILCKYIQNKVILNIIIVMIFLVGCTLSAFLPYNLPWGMHAAFVGIGFIHIGRLLRKKKCNKILNLKIYELIIVCIMAGILIFKNGYVNMRLGEYSNIALFWISSTLAIISLWNIAKKIEIVLCKCQPILCWFVSVGRNSITYLCLNQLFIYLFWKLFKTNAIDIGSRPLLQMIILAGTLVFCFFADIAIRKILPEILGKI